MAFITLILGLAVGYIAGAGIWRKLLARLGACATAASVSPPFHKHLVSGTNFREKRR
jgi:hypothetical protein